ncbi:NAD(P)/FAD-dependent oxidoreductase [Saccharospirillum salsuginis]|uniref:Dehydrogenase (Flavoprotein) n=1 Tax=Saccharospirillum salsuginis TaxID=418750 RepID=A0A918K0L5_9GAMM|nr:tryptophan 7-halogenase [Saccharospirillum salsuginis]GGX38253.1 hypothetical protein GCM10007392_00490 [Saccharospirillum salsuginis]
MRMTDTPIVIVGGGPAGAATALSLKRLGFNRLTVLCDQDDRIDPNAIGESLPPGARAVLRRLGLDALLDGEAHRPCPGSWSLWGRDQPGFNDFLLDPNGRGYHLDRSRFNEQLLEALANADVELMRPARLTSIAQTPLGFGLSGTRKGRPFHREFPVMVDASGAAAAAVRRLGVARNVYDDLIAVCGFVDCSDALERPDHTLLEGDTSGWWYGARLPGDRCLLSFTSDWRTVRERGIDTAVGFVEAYRRTRLLSRNLPCPKPEELDRVIKPAPVAILSGVAGVVEQGVWLAVGDAACSFDPISSAGITKALDQGQRAANAIDAWCRTGQSGGLLDYQSGVFSEFSEHIKLRQQYYLAEYRHRGGDFWRRRIEPTLSAAVP